MSTIFIHFDIIKWYQILHMQNILNKSYGHVPLGQEVSDSPLHWGADAETSDMGMEAQLRGVLLLGVSGFSF